MNLQFFNVSQKDLDRTKMVVILWYYRNPGIPVYFVRVKTPEER